MGIKGANPKAMPSKTQSLLEAKQGDTIESSFNDASIVRML